ncbi:MAG: formylmethanofuran dehydrogenase subunit E family protein [Candidatus Cloacimonetes bacterium]|nr:formylmethanofuran dehydrogenase subunit E family protein [Candidatus Cloacimonadota bacterium]
MEILKIIPDISVERDSSVELAIQKITEFHGRYAPGVVIAAYMVDLALELLPVQNEKLNAIAESRVCLADAIQVMTGCTLGNKYLHVKDYGRYALCVYGRDSKQGIRISVDLNKIDPQKTPILKQFFEGSRTYESVPRHIQQGIVTQEFLSVKRNILRAESVLVNLPAKPPLYSLEKCLHCGEFFRPNPTLPQCLCQTEPLLYS